MTRLLTTLAGFLISCAEPSSGLASSTTMGATAPPSIPVGRCEGNHHKVASVESPGRSDLTGMCRGYCELTVLGDLFLDLDAPPAVLDCIALVTGRVEITGEAENGHKLPNLQFIGGSLTMYGALPADDMLPGLWSVGGLSVRDNDKLRNLHVFSALRYVGGDIEIVRNDCLKPTPTENFVGALGSENVAGKVTIDIYEPGCQ